MTFGTLFIQSVCSLSCLPVEQGLCLSGALDPNRTSSFSPPVRAPAPPPPLDSDGRGNRGGPGSAEESDSGAQGIHLLLRPPDLLSPSLPPPLPPHTEPTLTPPPSWEQGPSLEEAWGSGDYLETLSFMVPDVEELALATPLPNHPYDHDHDWMSYDTAFPSRPTLPLSSRTPLSPSLSTPNIPLHTRSTRPDVFPTWDEDYDLEDMMPLEPTELLLPDMNSLEYYTNLLARERDRDRERVRGTDSQPSITPTSTQVQHFAPSTSPGSGPSPGREAERPAEGATPPLTLSPTLTTEEKSTSIKTSPPPSSPAARPKDRVLVPGRHPGSPPSNTTGQVPPPPPLGPPTRPDRPERPPIFIEKPDRIPTRTTTKPTTTTTTQTTSTQITAISLTRAPPVTTPRAAQTPPTRQYLCNITKPEMYLVRVGKTRKVSRQEQELQPLSVK